MTMRHLFLVLTACTATALPAAEPDPRAQAKAVWSEASRTGDLWTCFQLEEWGKAQKPALKLGPAMPGVLVAGSTLSALPEAVVSLADLGERVVATTPRRLFVLAPDGRPLQRSLPLPFPAWTQALGPGGRSLAVGVVAAGEGERPPTLRVGAIATEQGRQLLSIVQNVERGQSLEGLVVADDGSAAAAYLYGDSDHPALGRQVLVATRDKAVPIRNAWSPVAVGRNGAWAVVYGDGGRDLVRGERRQRIDAVACGPGLAAVLAGGVVSIVLADGSDRVLETGVAIGTDPVLSSVGGWLALNSGWGAKVTSDGDLLGEGAGTQVEQPSTLVLWRWADLANDPAARPAATMVCGSTLADDHPASLLLWNDRRIDLLDLGGPEPQRRLRQNVPLPVSWAAIDHHLLTVSFGEGRRALYGPDGSELWAGVADGLQVRRQDMALSWRQDRAAKSYAWQLQWLAADPEKRREVPAELEPLDLAVEVGFRGQDWVVGRTEKRWRRVGLDGKLIDQGDAARPQTLEWDVFPGRFYRDGGHIIPRVQARSEPSGRFFIQDGWRFGAMTMLLDDRGRVLSSGKKKGDWTEIGVIPAGDRFAMAARTPIVVGPPDNLALGTLTPGPKAVAQVPDGLAKAEEMPPGPWRIEDATTFSLPRGKRLRWDSDRIGFEPLRLRSPEGAGLFVVTRTALLELQAEEARAVGIPAP